MKQLNDNTELNREQKIDLVKGLLSGKKTISEVLPKKQIAFVDLLKVDDQPGLYFDASGKMYTEDEKSNFIEICKAGAELAMVEVKTYKTLEDATT